MTAQTLEKEMLRQTGGDVPLVAGVLTVATRPKCHPESRLAVHYLWRERKLCVSCDACERPILTLDVKAR